MPTEEIFLSQPPFPDDVPTCNLPRLSYGRLLARDPAESKRLFEASTHNGFFLLDLQDTPEGESFTKDAVGVLELDREVSALDISEKLRFTILELPHLKMFGYKALGSMKLESGETDCFESYSVLQDSVLGTGAPQAHALPIERSKTLLKSFIHHGYDICTVILGHLDTHLDLPSGTLASLHPTSKPSMTTVRLIHVPPQPAGKPKASMVGHTDNGSITILFNVIGGLQILPPGLANEDCNWRWVRPEPGCAIVNIGDALVQWSGGVLRSNMHRVMYAPGHQTECERYSFAYVLKPDNQASMRRLVPTTTAIAMGKGDVEDDHYIYKDWLKIKSLASTKGKNLVRVSSVSDRDPSKSREDCLDGNTLARNSCSVPNLVEKSDKSVWITVRERVRETVGLIMDFVYLRWSWSKVSYLESTSK